MTQYSNPYAVLGLAPGASFQEVKERGKGEWQGRKSKEMKRRMFCVGKCGWVGVVGHVMANEEDCFGFGFLARHIHLHASRLVCLLWSDALPLWYSLKGRRIPPL